MEWWWWRGFLTAANGHRFGFMLDVTSKPWAHYYGVDYGLTDLTNRTYHYRKEPLIIGEPPTIVDRFDLQGQDAGATGGNGHDRLHIDLDGYKLTLSLTATRPPVYLFGNGYINAYCNNAYFYTRPRMRISGTLRHAGTTTRLTGTAIFDRNWGADPAQEIAGWDWLNFKLNNGRDVVIILATLKKGNTTVTVKTGLISDSRGREVHLHPSDLQATPTRYWQRDSTCRYPVDWNIAMRTRGTKTHATSWLHLHAHALLDQTETRSFRTPLAYALWPGWPLIWDGPTSITGDTTGQRVSGYLCRRLIR
jgi:predicted secreted hydrolase